jgi:UDP-N-acetyl-D-galactosamine dehydrogenase
MTFDINNLRIGVIGLGYVGLPLAVEFGRRFPTVGFDINDARIQELEGGSDSTLEVTPEELAAAGQLGYTSDVSALCDCNFYIVTVPTPISRSKKSFACHTSRKALVSNSTWIFLSATARNVSTRATRSIGCRRS